MADEVGELAAAQAGDAGAFGRLYDRHAPVVVSLCRRRCLAEAEDAVQETFMRAFRMLHQVDAPERFGPWLYAIARRVCWERRRSAGRRNHHEGRAAGLGARSGAAGGNGHVTATPAGEAERGEQLDRLGAALAGLPDDERLAIHLHYLEADAAAVAAETMGLSRGGFYKLLARARKRLAGLMREKSRGVASGVEEDAQVEKSRRACSSGHVDEERAIECREIPD